MKNAHSVLCLVFDCVGTEDVPFMAEADEMETMVRAGAVKDRDAEPTQGEDLLQAAAKAAAEAAADAASAAAEQKLSGPGPGSPSQPSGDASPVDPAIHNPYTNIEPMSSQGSAFFDKNTDDDLPDDNPVDGDEFNDAQDDGMDIDDADADLEEKLASGELSGPLNQMSTMTTSLLPDSNVKLEKLQSTRVAVAQFAENNMPNLVGGPPTDLATLQSAIYTLQQQQLIQLQILQQLQQQLMAGMAPSMSNLQAMMQATQSLLPPIAAMAKLTPQIGNAAAGSNLSPPSSTAMAATAPSGSSDGIGSARSKSPGAAVDRKPLLSDDNKDDQLSYTSHKQSDRSGSPMSHLTKMVEVGECFYFRVLSSLKRNLVHLLLRKFLTPTKQ